MYFKSNKEKNKPSPINSVNYFLYRMKVNGSHNRLTLNIKDARSLSFRSELFTSYILTIFKQLNRLP